MPSKPSKAILVWKRRDQAINQFSFGSEAALDYATDSDASATGTQNSIAIDGVMFNACAPTLDVFSIAVSPAGKRKSLRFIETEVVTTLSGNHNSSTTTISVATGSGFKDGDFLLVNSERMTVLSANASSLTVTGRGEHGTTADNHLGGDNVTRVVSSVPHKAITLVGDTTALSAPTLSIVAVDNGFDITFTAPSDPLRKLDRYEVFRDTASPATTSIDTFSAKGGQTQVYHHRLKETDVKTSTYYFRSKAIDKSGNKSGFSNEVSGIPLTSGPVPTVPAKPTAPTIALVGNGGVNGAYEFLGGIAFTDTTGAGSVTKSEYQLAGPSSTFDTTTGLSSAILNDEHERPPTLVNMVVPLSSPEIGGSYQFTARIYNAVYSGWSDWASPDSAPTSWGQKDDDVPGAPRVFQLADNDDNLGNGFFFLVQEPRTNSRSIFGYDVQGKSTDFAYSASTASGIEDNTGLRAVQGFGLGTVTHGGRVLTITGSSFSAVTSALEDDVLYVHEGMPVSGGKLTGKIEWPHAYAISTNTTIGLTSGTITISSDDGFSRSDGQDGSVEWFVAEGWQLPPASGMEFIRFHPTQNLSKPEGYGPDEEAFIGEIRKGENLYWRARAHGQWGIGPWIYHNGSFGTTTEADKTKFTVTSLIAAGALANSAVTSSKIATSAVTSDAIASGAVTAVKQSRGSMPVSSTVGFTSDAGSAISWSTGLVYYTDGTSESVNAGSATGLTANATYWVYKTVGNATLAVTSNPGDLVGDSEVSLAVVMTTNISGETAGISSVVAAGTVFTAPMASIAKLSSISADIGEVTAGTVTGALLRTSSTGERCEISNSDDDIRFYNSSSSLVASIEVSSGGVVGFNFPSIRKADFTGGLQFESYTTNNTHSIVGYGENASDGSALLNIGVMYYKPGAGVQVSTTMIQLSASFAASGEDSMTVRATKLGLFSATPVEQPDTDGTTAGFTEGSATGVRNDSTFTGGTGSKAYTIGDIVKALKDIGIMAAS